MTKRAERRSTRPMIVRIYNHLAPLGYSRIETRLLPQPGDTIAIETSQGRIVYAVQAVGTGDEPMLTTVISESNAPDHFGRPVSEDDAIVSPEDDLPPPLGIED